MIPYWTLIKKLGSITWNGLRLVMNLLRTENKARNQWENWNSDVYHVHFEFSRKKIFTVKYFMNIETASQKYLLTYAFVRVIQTFRKTITWNHLVTSIRKTINIATQIDLRIKYYIIYIHTILTGLVILISTLAFRHSFTFSIFPSLAAGKNSSSI